VDDVKLWEAGYALRHTSPRGALTPSREDYVPNGIRRWPLAFLPVCAARLSSTTVGMTALRASSGGSSVLPARARASSARLAPLSAGVWISSQPASNTGYPSTTIPSWRRDGLCLAGLHFGGVLLFTPCRDYPLPSKDSSRYGRLERLA